MKFLHLSIALTLPLATLAIADRADAQCTSGPTTFCVTQSDPKPPNHPNPGGCTCYFAIDDTPGLELTLTRGVAYTFQLKNIPGLHPFQISDNSFGADGGAGAIMDGVDGNGSTGNAVLTFTPRETTPNTVYYACFFHANMGWRINIIDPPTCPADFNGVNGVTVQDIFDFLAAWFAMDTDADFNQMNGVTVQDIFDFLAAWFANC